MPQDLISYYMSSYDDIETHHWYTYHISQFMITKIWWLKMNQPILLRKIHTAGFSLLWVITIFNRVETSSDDIALLSEHIITHFQTDITARDELYNNGYNEAMYTLKMIMIYMRWVAVNSKMDYIIAEHDTSSPWSHNDWSPGNMKW